jgi:hypothetical protein
VSEELLHGADVVASVEQIGGKAVAQRVRADGLGSPAGAPERGSTDSFEVRYVSRNNGIPWERYRVNVSSVLAEEHVGLEEIDDGIWTLYCADYLLARLNERTHRLAELATGTSRRPKRNNCQPCLGEKVSAMSSGAHYHPPVSSHDSSMGIRSQPQNGSPSTRKNGEPKTPLAIPSAVAAFTLVFMGSLVSPASNSAAGSPRLAPTEATVAGTVMSRPSAK